MSREQDYKIAEWCGYVFRNTDSHGNATREYWLTHVDGAITRTNYTTSDSDAITLLPVLVERGYTTVLMGYSKGYGMAIGQENNLEEMTTVIDECNGKEKPTIAAAICSAVLALIEKEAEQ